MSLHEKSKKASRILPVETQTLSAGLIVVGPKFPVSGFSKEVGRALEKAKGHDGKNAICVFDEVLTWEEFQHSWEIRNSLYDLVSHKGESKALIWKVKKSMRGYSRIQQRILEKKGIPLVRVWRLNYYLKDVKKGNIPQIQRDIIERYESLLKEVLKRNDKAANPALISVGARWAEFMTRRKKDN